MKCWDFSVQKHQTCIPNVVPLQWQLIWSFLNETLNKMTSCSARDSWRSAALPFNLCSKLPTVTRSKHTVLYEVLRVWAAVTYTENDGGQQATSCQREMDCKMMSSCWNKAIKQCNNCYHVYGVMRLRLHKRQQCPCVTKCRTGLSLFVYH